MLEKRAVRVRHGSRSSETLPSLVIDEEGSTRRAQNPATIPALPQNVAMRIHPNPTRGAAPTLRREAAWSREHPMSLTLVLGRTDRGCSGWRSQKKHSAAPKTKKPATFVAGLSRC